MKKRYLKIGIVPIAFAVIAMSAPMDSIAQDKPKAGSTMQTAGLQQRIDFGNAHIMGQSIKSGAVYLMHRKKSDIDSMLKVRRNYRSEIKEEYGLANTALTEDEKKSTQEGKTGQAVR